MTSIVIRSDCAAAHANRRLTLRGTVGSLITFREPLHQCRVNHHGHSEPAAARSLSASVAQNDPNSAAKTMSVISRTHLIVLVFASAALAGCGGAGDSFLDFHKPPNATPSPGPNTPVAVAKITVSAPSSYLVRTQAGSFPLAITAYDANGKPIPVGTPFLYPVSISSDSSGFVSFTTTSSGGTSSASIVAISDNATQVYLNYNPCGSGGTSGCTGDSNNINVTAVSPGASPGSLTLTTVAQPVSAGPPQVTQIQLAILGTAPNLGTAGTYPLQITATNNGVVIPLGSSFLYPISLTSNASCELSFGTSPSITSYNTSTINVPHSSTLVYVSFNPGLVTPACPAPASPIITATAPGATTTTFPF